MPGHLRGRGDQLVSSGPSEPLPAAGPLCLQASGRGPPSATPTTRPQQPGLCIGQDLTVYLC